MEEGDLLVIAMRPDDHVLVIVAEQGSDMEGQIRWLFRLPEPQLRLSLRAALDNEQDRLGFASRAILDAIGVKVENDGATWLEQMLSRFGGDFPDTTSFSGFARETLSEIIPSDLHDNPDQVLLAWFEREEILFRTLEKHLMAERLHQGFGGDNLVEQFDEYAKRIMNRRKVRAGLALENHLEYAFRERHIRFTRGGRTENNSRPDFIFPGIAEYHQAGYPVSLLTMLGVKTTCRDRWVQVLAEAAKINPKHLLTFEPAITPRQTEKMVASQIQLVVPTEIQPTYTDKQRQSLMSVADFMRHVERNQAGK